MSFFVHSQGIKTVHAEGGGGNSTKDENVIGKGRREDGRGTGIRGGRVEREGGGARLVVYLLASLFYNLAWEYSLARRDDL